jgi:hypothetical protein
MSVIRNILSITVLVCLAAAGPGAAERPRAPLSPQLAVDRAPVETRDVDLVFCLDVSGSMKPLLDEVRARLWEVVNEFSGMTPSPELRIGLMVYGSGKTERETGRIVIQHDLTADLDDVYSTLMSLETSGGEEYVGWAIHRALEEFSWSDDGDALRILLIAGNEEADQASEHYDFRNEARRAFDEGVTIHALYAGTRDKAVKHRWPEIADWSRGTYAPVKPSPNVVNLETPLDAPLTTLNQRYNATFVPVGSVGADALTRVQAQDEAAESLGAQSLGSRIATKAGGLLGTASWDLVDAASAPGFDLATIDPADLPEEMRYMSYGELFDLLEAKRAEREAIKVQILEADAERREFIRKRSSRNGQPGVVDAMREAVRSDAESRGFTAGRAR